MHSNGKNSDEPERMRFETEEFYVKSEEEMRKLFPALPEAYDNTVKIAQRCQVEIRFGEYHLPEFKVPEGYTNWTYFSELCWEGFAQRYPDADEAVRAQLEYEMKNNCPRWDMWTISSLSQTLWHLRKKQASRLGPAEGVLPAVSFLIAYISRTWTQ